MQILSWILVLFTLVQAKRFFKSQLDVPLFQDDVYSYNDIQKQEFIDRLLDLDQAIQEYDSSAPSLFQSEPDAYYDSYDMDYQDYFYNGRIPSSQASWDSFVNNVKGWWNKTTDHFKSGDVLGGMAQFNPVNAVAQLSAPSSPVTKAINGIANIGAEVGMQVLNAKTGGKAEIARDIASRAGKTIGAAIDSANTPSQLRASMTNQNGRNVPRGKSPRQVTRRPGKRVRRVRRVTRPKRTTTRRVVTRRVVSPSSAGKTRIIRTIRVRR